MDNLHKCVERVNLYQNAMKRKMKCLANNQDLENEDISWPYMLFFFIAVMFLQRQKEF